MQKVELSLTAQIALGLAVAMLFSLALAFSGYMAANQEHDKIAAFASDRAVATGTITRKRIDDVRPTQGGIWVYWLDIEFKTASGKVRDDSIQVANSIYDRYQPGDKVEVTYVRAKPEWFYIPGTAPTQRDVAMGSGMNWYGLIGAGLCAAGLVALFLFGRTRPPGSGTPATSPFVTPPAARPLRGPRSSFGTRRTAR